MFRIVETTIDPNALYDRIAKNSAGSVVIHHAVVRGQTDGKATASIEFVQKGDAELEMRGIADALRKEWKIEDVLIVRRVGKLAIGDVISVVAVSAPRREDAFSACKRGVELLKKMQTVRKTEVFKR